ncbi:unnamed protein product [Calypogeia fissa]
MAGRACWQALRRRGASSSLIAPNNVGQSRTIVSAITNNNNFLQQEDGKSKLLDLNLFQVFQVSRLSNYASRDLLLFKRSSGCGPSRDLSLFDRRDNARRWMSSGRFSDEEESPPPLWLSQREVVGEVGDVDVLEGNEVEEVEADDEVEGDGDVPARPPSPLDLMLQGVPRRRQRFMMQKALKIKSEGEDEERASRRGFEMKVIDVNRTVKVTKGGKVQSFSAVVITGNYDGVVGFGKGKASEVGRAIDKASLKALNNLHYFERFQGHTIFHEHDSKFEKTKIYLWPGRSGTGMRASTTVGGILRLAGFKNVKSKVVGSRHPFNTVKAVFKTLSEIESPEEVGERRGRVVVESHLVTDSA